ncbi:MAG: EF2563 family selenium-dependent molybdenum hydroxylase system protein [Planctomycetaceae bacterium]|nr:EF2563 family selenium-dependent molybdenum hydroxylase system protein [Planctomycetaceae bacterium]
MKSESPFHRPIIIKGAGEMATGVAVRLYRAGFRHLLMLEVAQPMAVRRAVSFCEAVYDGEQSVEGVAATLLVADDESVHAWERGRIAVAVDPDWTWLDRLQPAVSIDAVIAKRNLGTRKDEAPLVVALGPGFTAGRDAHYVVETQRGHNLGRLLASGIAEPNTGIPGNIGGYTRERVLRAPTDGTVEDALAIGDTVAAGDVVCTVDGEPVKAAIPGVVRGMIRPGILVRTGMKIGDIDPRGEKSYCFTVSEKARALGGAVLEAVCAHFFVGHGTV